MRRRRLCLMLSSVALLSAPLRAQTIGGRVVDRTTTRPLRALAVRVLDDSDHVVAESRTDTSGIFYAVLASPARVRLRFALDSLDTFDTDSFTVEYGGFYQRQFMIERAPIFTDVQVEKQVAQVRSSILPRYPAELKDRGITGDVLVRFVVDSAGRIRPGSIRVLQSSDPAFTDAVLTALHSARYLPAEIGGRRVMQMVQQPFSFRLSAASVRSSSSDGAPPPFPPSGFPPDQL